MLYNYFIIFCCFAPVALMGQNTFKITTGTTLKLTSGAIITLDNMHLDNDGSISLAPSDGSFRFTGNTATHIIGSSIPLFDVLEIAKTGDAQLSLQQSVSINSGIYFTSGVLNLNNNNILLAPTALLNGESATTYITGANGGFVEIATILNAPTSENPGNLGAIFTSTQNFGNTIIRRGHQSQTNGGGNGNSVLRYYDILPANNTALNAVFRFSYLDAELNGLEESSLVMWKSPDNMTWSNQGFTSRDIAFNYVEKANIDAFSRWTLSSVANALPLIWGSFNTSCVNNNTLITWKTMQEFNTHSFLIQRSSNGSNWTEVTVINAAGQSNEPIDYSFTDVQSTSAFYRIIQTDIDGKNTSSPALRSNCTGKEFFNVYPNPVQRDVNVAIYAGNSQAVMVQVYDNKGVLVKRQQKYLQQGLNQFVINLANLAAGEYNLVINWPDALPAGRHGKQRTIKLIKNQ